MTRSSFTFSNRRLPKKFRILAGPSYIEAMNLPAWRTLAMGYFPFLFAFLALGCGSGDASKTPSPKSAAASAVISGALPPESTATTIADDEDWPSFLGPLGTSVSKEKGILRLAEGRLARRLADSVGHRLWSTEHLPGRLFLFDRIDDQRPPPLPQSPDRRAALEVRLIHPTTKIATATITAPAAVPLSMATAFTSSASRGCCTACAPRTAGIVWKVDTQEKFGVLQNFFGVGSAPVIEGDLLIARSAAVRQETTDISSGKLKGNGSGVVAFDKKTGRSKVADQRRTGQLRQPGAGNHRRPPLVLRLRPRRPDRVRPGQRQAGFPLSLAGPACWKASTPATRWSSATGC